MARYKTKPFMIEAVQFTGNNYEEVNTFAENKFSEEDQPDQFDGDIKNFIYDELHSTWVGVKVNQWIIKGNKGEFYPCDPEIFEAKYERAD